MQSKTFLLLSAAVVALAVPTAFGSHDLSMPSAQPVSGTVSGSFDTVWGTAVWWDYSVINPLGVGAVPLVPAEQTQAFEVDSASPVIVTAEATDISTADTGAPICAPVEVPDSAEVAEDAPTAVVHGGANGVTCVKANGYTVQVHYFPWSGDRDHVVSPTSATPTATNDWRVDAVPTSYKTATIPAGHWQVWIDPAISPMLPYTVEWSFAGPASWNFAELGHRGCVFYASQVAGMSDESILGCPKGYGS